VSAAPVQAAPSHLDLFLPRSDFGSRHQIAVRASAEKTFAALQSASMADALLARLLLRLRGYGADVAAREAESFPEHLARQGFVPLSMAPREMVFGIAGRFWRPDGCLVRLTASEFVLFAEPGYAKAAWNLAVHEIAPGNTLLTTETRIQAFGRAAAWKFGAYWAVVKPFSGLVRRSLLRQVKRLAER
jgi:hypothetical protein